MAISEKENLKTPLLSEQKALSKEIDFLKNKVFRLRMDFLRENPDFAAENDITGSFTLPGAMEHNLLIETLKRKQQEFDDLQDKAVEPILEPFDEEKEYSTIANEKLISTLIKMADKFDQEGKFELSAEVDKTLESLAARPKAPLKHLEDGTKKSLLIFLHKADNEVKTALNLLQEFFKRLRYFDIDETVEHMNLDRVMIYLQKNEEHLSIATRKFYEMTAGKRPGKTDLETLINGEPVASPIQPAEDFFESQNKKDEPKKEETVETKSEEKSEHCEQCKEDCSGECYCHDKLDEQELEGFWQESTEKEDK